MEQASFSLLYLNCELEARAGVYPMVVEEHLYQNIEPLRIADSVNHDTGTESIPMLMAQTVNNLVRYHTQLDKENSTNEQENFSIFTIEKSYHSNFHAIAAHNVAKGQCKQMLDSGYRTDSQNSLHY